MSGGVPELVTRAAGDVKDAIGRPVEAGQLAAVDPDCRSIALHLYDGQLKVCLYVWCVGRWPTRVLGGRVLASSVELSYKCALLTPKG